MRILQYIFSIFLFVGTSFAETINIDWIDGSTTYAQTTCIVGGDVILPTPPTKRGYTFAGWCVLKRYSDGITLPCEYDRLEYIESTGTQYIDTGIIPTATMKWVLDNEFTKIGTIGLGYSFNGVYDSKNPILRFDIALTTDGLILDYGNSNLAANHPESFLNTRMVYIVDSKNMIWSYGETTGSFPSYSIGSVTRTKSIYLFGRNDGEGGFNRPSFQKTYSSEFYNNDVLIQKLIPAKRNSDNVVGMYDTVSGHFFINAGTGEFIAGPVVDALNE